MFSEVVDEDELSRLFTMLLCAYDIRMCWISPHYDMALSLLLIDLVGNVFLLYSFTPCLWLLIRILYLVDLHAY